MTLTKIAAWTMFRAQMLQQIEGANAINSLTKEELEQYEEFAAEFEMELAKVGIEAQNEAAGLHETCDYAVQTLEAKKPYEWVAEDYRMLVEIYEGSKYEKLHLAHIFRIQNNELLLDLVKPS
jgi:hypothetical protein